jgi:hypothetical protein
MMQRSQEQLRRFLSDEVIDELWELRAKRWQRRILVRSAVVFGAFESFQFFFDVLNEGRVTGVGVWSGAGVLAGAGVRYMRGVRVDEGSIDMFEKRNVMWMLMLDGGAEIIARRWRDLSPLALGELTFQDPVSAATAHLTNRERTLMLRMAEGFHGTLGDLVDAVQALS